MTFGRLDSKPLATRKNYRSVSPSTFPIKGAGGNKTDFPVLHLLNKLFVYVTQFTPRAA